MRNLPRFSFVLEINKPNSYVENYFMQMLLLNKLRDYSFLIKKSLANDLDFDSSLNFIAINDNAELLDTIQKEAHQMKFSILIIPEEDFYNISNFLRDKIELQNYGIIVISEKPENFLLQKHGFYELIDSIKLHDLSKSEEWLLRVIRYIENFSESRKLNQKTFQKLNEIFIAISSERDQKKLITTILLKAIELTKAESGVLYMIDEKDGEFFFGTSIKKIANQEITFENVNERVTETSICGYTALTGKTVNIVDISLLKPFSLPFYNRDIDLNSPNLKTLLCVPLRNRRNETIAVLELCNKNYDKNEHSYSEPFGLDDEGLLTSFGTQSAICLENVDLYSDIKKLFDGFVKAAVIAIESRDPSTGGHSERVARMSVALARAVSECETGIYRSVKFKEEEIQELNYAALLHDFGKIGVREEVLVKAKKLYQYQMEAIRERIKACKVAARMTYLEKLLKEGNRKANRFLEEYNKRLESLDNYWEIIVSSNEPSVLKKDCKDTLEKIRNEKLLLPDNSTVSLLTEEEFNALSVLQGSLTDNERLEVESHVRHTYQFLKMIPWTKDFRHITEIAYAHHEKLDGSGYPRGLLYHEIPLQSKIITIVDIFDALTAADRWYKDAVTVERAIEILGEDVKAGKLDPVLFELFVEKRIYELNKREVKVA